MADGLGYTEGAGKHVASAERDVGGGTLHHFQRLQADVVEFALAPAVTAGSAYVAGDCLGGLIEIAGAVRVAGDALRIHRFFASLSVASGGAWLYLFSDEPAAAFADHAAFPALPVADRAKARLLGYNVGDQTDGTYHCLAASRPYCDDLPDMPLVTTSLWVALKVGGTPTFPAVDDLHVTIGAELL